MIQFQQTHFHFKTDAYIAMAAFNFAEVYNSEKTDPIGTAKPRITTAKRASLEMLCG